MSLLPGDLIAYTAFEKNPASRIEGLAVELRQNYNPEVITSDLSAISENLGVITSGTLAFGNDHEIDSPEFSGVFISYPAITIGAETVHIGGINLGTLKFGLSAEDGEAIFAGGAARLNELGAIFTGINYFLRFKAENAGTSRWTDFSTFLPTDSTTPAFAITHYDPVVGSNLQTNGDFELGNLNNFDAADSGTPAWSADSGSPASGTYAAKFNTTAEVESNLQTNGNFATLDYTGWTTAGTGDWATPFGGGSFGTTQTVWIGDPSETGTLTTNLGGTPRMAVTAGKYYLFSLISNVSTTGKWSVAKANIKWYTATSGGSLVSTSSDINLGQLLTPSYSETAQALLAPATAAGAEIVITITRNASSGNVGFGFTNVEFGEAQSGTLTTNLGGTPRMAVTAGNSYQFNLDYKTDNLATTWTLVQALIKWYTATSGGSLVSTTTTPLSPGTSYANYATSLTAPPTAAGAEIVLYAVRGTTDGGSTNLYFDNVQLTALTVSRSLKFLPNVTLTDGPLDLAEIAAPSTPASGYTSDYADTENNRRYVKDTGQDVLYLIGHAADSVSFSDTAATNTIITRVVKANSLGSKGFIRTRINIVYLNNSGENKKITVTYNFGSYSFSVTSAVQAASATGRHQFNFEFLTYSNQATNAQRHVIREDLQGTATAIAADTFSNNILRYAWGSSTVDTTGDVTVSATVAANAANASQTTDAVGMMEGPYYNA